MDLRFLSYFISVYEQGSISGAARQCYISQPSISQAVKQLEQELNSKLFERYSRGVVATSDGRKLYPLAKKLIADAAKMKQQFSQANVCTPFRLGLSRALGVESISGLLQQFSQKIASLELTLVDHNDSHDARIITQTLSHQDEIFQVIWHDKYVLAVPVGHQFSLEKTVSLAQLDQIPFISRQSCEGQTQLFYAMEKQGYNTNNRAKIQTVEYALGLVGAGVGVALVPNSQASMVRDNLRIIEIADVIIERTIGLAYSKSLKISEPLSELINICSLD